MSNTDDIYVQALRRRLVNLKGRIARLKSSRSFYLTEENVAVLKREYDEINREIEEHSFAGKDRITDRFDHNYQARKERIDDAKSDINDLKELRSTLTTASAKRRVLRRIDHIQRRINRMNRTQNILNRIERPYIVLKSQRAALSRRIKAGALGREDNARAYYEDNERIRATLRPGRDTFGGVIDTIRDRYYEHRGNSYLRNAERYHEVVEEMNSSTGNVRMAGAYARVAYRRGVDALRARAHTHTRGTPLTA